MPVLGAFSRFFHHESAGGAALLVSAVAALAWANSPWAASYAGLWQTQLLGHSFAHWINDGLMTLFFFAAGLEIRREFSGGELSTWRKGALPIAAAAGGMIAPALIYAALNHGGAGAAGWGVPMATDIAFSLGILRLLGSRVPPSLKVFLTALAIADDIGAVLVIAAFYSSGLAWPWLAAAAGSAAAMAALRALKLKSLAPYLVLGLPLWWSLLHSGVHATLAGVLLSLLIPSRARDGSSQIERAERAVTPWTTYLVIPLFALANAGVSFAGLSPRALLHPAALGTVLGLVLGKQLGIVLSSWLAAKARVGELPEGVSWRQLYGVSWIAGIGFTMSLFVAGLAFPGGQLFEAAKLGILVAAVLAGVGGTVVLRLAARR